MELFYREFGKGSPVMILHGLFGFSDNWQTIAKGLAGGHLVITPDLRNHGRSPHTDTNTYAEMAEDIRAFMESRWMFSAALIGHSMGGKVAMQLALNYPDLVEKLVVVDMAPGQASDNHSDIFRALLDLDLSKIATRKQAESILGSRITDSGTLQFLLKNITRKEDGSYSWKMNLPALWRGYPDILAPVQGEPFDKPVLFIRGSRSDYVRDGDLPAIRKLFPQAEVISVRDAGHWVHADQPAELLAVLKRFLG